MAEHVVTTVGWNIFDFPCSVASFVQGQNFLQENLVRDQVKALVKVGSVDFQRDDSQGNPVVAYLQRCGSPEGLVVPLPNGGYSLTKLDENTTFNAPLTNEAYLQVSGDFNPSHVNPYFSDYASLPATITHGLWSSAATRRYVETIVAHGHPERVLAYVVHSFTVVIQVDCHFQV